MLERSSPQLVITSTAHRRATSLMRKYLTDAMTGDDPTVLLLLWGAPMGADPSDPAVWKAASPHWSEDRRATLAAKYEKALAGEQDPDLDDPDPMRGFEAQYLNVWRIAALAVPGLPVISEIAWAGLTSLMPARVPDAVAVESWFGDGVAVARGWNTDDGRVVVAVTDHPDVPAAAHYIADLGQRRPVTAGASIADHAAWKDAKVRTAKRSETTRTAVGDLKRYLAEDKFRHTDTTVLNDQVTELRTSPGIDGPRIRSTGRMDAVKAAMWAIHDASTNRRRRATIPSRYRKP
jgi:phage terminase large subunit-like protein